MVKHNMRVYWEIYTY